MGAQSKFENEWKNAFDGVRGSGSWIQNRNNGNA